MDKLQEVIDFLSKQDYVPECGMFNCRNTVGDTMENIYDKDGVQIDACWGFDYLEIFGLDDTEFKKLHDHYERTWSFHAKVQPVDDIYS